MQSEKEQVALSSIAASAGLTIAKGVVGFSTGSLAILSEAGHSLIDLGATVMTYIAVRISGKPADKEHHYGHGKVEAVSALAETALLFLLSGVVIWEATKRLVEHEGHVVEATVWAFGVIIVSMVVDFFRARALSQTAEKTSSHALEADALHFSSDLWSSLAVLIGLVGVHFGLPWADSAAALVVAVLVCFAGWRLGKKTIDTAGCRGQNHGHRCQSCRRCRCRASTRPRGRRKDLHRPRGGGQPHLAARPRKRAQGSDRRRYPSADAGRGTVGHYRSGCPQ